MIQYKRGGITTMAKRPRYKYSVGEVVNNLLITSPYVVKTTRKDGTTRNIKWYKYSCAKCPHIGEIRETHLDRGQGCSVCKGNMTCVQGVNDIATTNPECVVYFVDKELAHKVRRGSNKKVAMKCPHCEDTKNITPFTLVRYGYGCTQCGDGISYPQKVVRCLLNLLEIDYVIEYSPQWETLNGRRYDFFIPSLNMIIETHGKQHYEDSISWINKTYEETQANDKEKEVIALRNGVKQYVTLDCSVSSIEWIRQSILTSSLISFINVDNIDWNEIDKQSMSSKRLEVIKVWNQMGGNEGLVKTTEIAQFVGVHRKTVGEYLNWGAKLGLCKYNGKESQRMAILGKTPPNRQKVAIFKDGVELGRFNSRAELARKSEALFGVKLFASKIGDVCNGNRKTHKGYTFKNTKEN